MRKVKKRNILNEIDDKINDKIDEIKEKKNNKKKNNNKKQDSKFDKFDNKKSKSKKNSTKKNDKKKENKIKRSLWKKLIALILILCIIAVLAITAFLAFIVITAPKFSEDDLTIKEQTIIYDVDGEIITKLAIQNQKREIVTYDELPQVLIDAIIATEDSRFFQHNGVDLLRFIKATAFQLIGKDDAGGASTLTMQTVKNMITKKDQSENNKIKKVIREFQDVYLSVFKIEKQYSKEEILEIYVNDNYLGGGYYGVKEASKYYFGKEVSELTLPEAAMLAGLFQLPTTNNPYTNIEGASKRRDLVLDYMYMHNYITADERDLAKKIDVESLLVGNTGNDNKYQGYIDTVITEVEELTNSSPYMVPMKIYTTMERSIQDGIDGTFACEKKDCWFWKDDYVQGGVAVVNVETGAIAAVGAGRNKTGARQFNYATQAKRQPGSTAKPLFAYGPGIEYNNFSSYTLFNDEPWGYTNGPSVNNWDGRYEGLITTRRALQISRNVPAIKAIQTVGVKNSYQFAHSLGLDVSYNSSSDNYRVLGTGVDNTINEAYAIGGVAEGFTPLEMASAYAAFANGGYYIEPYTVTKIEFRDTGEVKEYKKTKERVMKDSTAYIMNNILESATVSGFSGGARVWGSHVAAKTGTSNFDDNTMKKNNLPSYAVNDLWTVAYTSKYSVAVWYGYDEVTSTTYNTDGSPKDALTASVMQHIPKDTVGWSMPSSVVASEVEKETWPARLPSEYTPSDFRITEYFVRGTQPTEVSERFAKLNEVKNVKTVKGTNEVTITWSYDTPKVLTDEYLKSYFSNSQFGNGTDTLVANRKKYNSEQLGDVGFGIYQEDASGGLTLIDYVLGNEYTYKGYGDVKLQIKAEYEKFKANASNGVKVSVDLGELNVSQLEMTLNGSSTVDVNTSAYTEAGIKSIVYGTINVTNTATKSYSIASDSVSKSFDNAAELQLYVNTLPAGTYIITYSAEYLNNKGSKTRKVILR